MVHVIWARRQGLVEDPSDMRWSENLAEIARDESKLSPAGQLQRDPTKPKQRCALLQSRWRNEGSEHDQTRRAPQALKAESTDGEGETRRA